MSQITSENVALAIVRYVAARALPVLEPNLFMARLINRDFEPTLAQAGSTVDIPIAPKLGANNIAETGVIQTQSASLGNASVTLTSHIECSFQIPDVTKALANVDLISTFMQPAMLALATRIEMDLLGLFPVFTFNPAVGASGNPPTETVIDNIETNFFKSYVPPTVDKYLACSADFYAAVRQIPRFSEVQTIGSGDSMITGEFGKLKNINFFRSQLVAPVAGTTNNLAFTRDSMALVVRRLDLPLPGMGAVGAYAEYKNLSLRVLMSYNPSTLGQLFTCDILYGAAPLRNQFAMLVNS